ncbi:MAG: class II aldolase/adducin family protein [Calditrichaeota bacterium]|nr:class II aldolase/adducin family protein [Calditrichota bacterium]
MKKTLSELEHLKKLVTKIGKGMYKKHFSAPNDGNISFRYNDRIFISKSAKPKNQLKRSDLVEVDLEGNVLSEGKASTELNLHLRVYQQRPDVMGVVHAHPPYATAFAVSHQPLELNTMSEIVSTLGLIPLAEYATPSTDELPDSIMPWVKQCNAILLANHGAITYDSSLEQAWYNMERLEHYAQISFLSRQLGGEREIPDNQVDKLIEIRSTVYGIKSPQLVKKKNEK